MFSSLQSCKAVVHILFEYTVHSSMRNGWTLMDIRMDERLLQCFYGDWTSQKNEKKKKNMRENNLSTPGGHQNHDVSVY